MEERSDTTVTQGMPAAPTGPFTAWPSGFENPDETFQIADAEFRLGDWVSAQRDFGTLYIIAPNYGGNVPTEAITATCGSLGVDCSLVFGRLDLLRDAYYGTFGPRETWVFEQDRDFNALLGCYESMLLGDPNTAANAAAPVVTSPLPPFAQHAQRCMAAADGALAGQRQQAAMDQAFVTWVDNHSCMEGHRGTLMAAFAASDWEAFIDEYPNYQLCATELQNVIDSGILEGDPRVAGQYDEAWSNMSEIDLIVDDNRATYDATRDAIVRLDADPQYNALVVQWNELAFDEQRVLNQIASLESAQNTLQGSQRDAVGVQIDAQNSQLRDLRSELREVMGGINALRRGLGLPARERP
jgi:hypothetical protein